MQEDAKAESQCPLALSCLVLEIGLCGTSAGTTETHRGIAKPGQKQEHELFFLYFCKRSDQRKHFKSNFCCFLLDFFLLLLYTIHSCLPLCLGSWGVEKAAAAKTFNEEDAEQFSQPSRWHGKVERNKRKHNFKSLVRNKRAWMPEQPSWLPVS